MMVNPADGCRMRGAGGNNLRHLGRGKYLCGWETNQRPGLIRD